MFICITTSWYVSMFYDFIFFCSIAVEMSVCYDFDLIFTTYASVHTIYRYNYNNHCWPQDGYFTLKSHQAAKYNFLSLYRLPFSCSRSAHTSHDRLIFSLIPQSRSQHWPCGNYDIIISNLYIQQQKHIIEY